MMPPPRLLAALGVTVLLAACQAPIRAPTPEPSEAGLDTTPSQADAPTVDESAPLALAPENAEKAPAEATSVASGLILSRLQARLVTRTCSSAPEVLRWQHTYIRNPARFAAQIDASLPLLGYVVEEIERRGLPGEFALIPIVESGYRPDAMGPGGAAGMWQIMAATGRGEGMVVRGAYDGRLSVHRATEIAMGLLENAQARFGDWRIAAMAYNAGEFGIARAVKRHGVQLRPDGRLSLPGASKNAHAYVAKLEALACLMAEPERHGIVIAPDRDIARLVVVDIPSSLHRLDTAAGSLAIDAELLARWNAGYRQRAFVEGAPRQLLVPMSTREQWPALANARDTPPPEPPRLATYIVRLGDNLWSIARRHGVRLKELMHWNRLDEKSVLKPGQALRVTP